MEWRRPGDKPLSKPIMVSSLTHICVTRPQWVNVINKILQHIDCNLTIICLFWNDHMVWYHTVDVQFLACHGLVVDIESIAKVNGCQILNNRKNKTCDVCAKINSLEPCLMCTRFVDDISRCIYMMTQLKCIHVLPSTDDSIRVLILIKC